jgi:organic hydroperoxide reductase OsmC/OhrA
MDTIHRYAAECRWEGSTALGYDRFDRTHQARALPVSADRPAPAGLVLSADPAFRGDPAWLNPEQLLVLAASSCQLLSFLAVCARARLDVRRYEDHAEAVMPEGDRPVRLTAIVLRPHIVLAAGPSEARVRELIEVAHRECYIASSLKTDIRVEATLAFV